MVDEVCQHLRAMLACGAIRESKSPLSFPTVRIRKRDDTLRFCIDFRELNRRTVRDSYQLPRSDESTNALSGSKWFSTMDLKSGYWQVEMEEAHKERIAFRVGSLGFWECNSMPFGLINTPSTFQRVLEQCLGDLHLQRFLLYIDDIVVFSKTTSEHFQYIKDVLSRFRAAGMKLKPSKRHFLQRSVHYSGHIISCQGVQTEPEKVEDALNWTIPKSVDDVRRFLGFTGFYRRFIKDYASITHTLTNMFVGDGRSGRKAKVRPKPVNAQNPFVWDEVCQKSFGCLKLKLTSAPIWGYADFSIPFELHVDASLSGLDAVLYQKQNGKK